MALITLVESIDDSKTLLEQKEPAKRTITLISEDENKVQSLLENTTLQRLNQRLSESESLGESYLSKYADQKALQESIQAKIDAVESNHGLVTLQAEYKTAQSAASKPFTP